MEENEEITKFISTLEYKSMEEEANIISLLEKANKYIIILNKSITERISKLPILLLFVFLLILDNIFIDFGISLLFSSFGLLLLKKF